MDKKMYKTLAITLVFIFLFAGGFGLGMSKNITVGFDVDLDNQGGAPVATAPNTAVTSTSAPVSATAPAQSTKPAEGGQTNTAAENPTKPTAEPQNSSAMSVEEIVELYNKSVNRVKPEAKQINRNYNHVSIPEETLELPSAIQGIGKTAIGTFVKPDDTVQEWTTADDFKLGFPVGGEDYSSHLTADMVESATCKDNGDTYQLEIVLKDDTITSPAKGEGYAGVFNTTTASTFEDISIPTVTFNEVKINGIDGSISATIDKATKTVKDITFRNTDIMYLNVKVAFSTLEAKMNLVQEANYIITY